MEVPAAQPPACCLHRQLIFPFITSPFGNCESRACRESARGLCNLHTRSRLAEQPPSREPAFYIFSMCLSATAALWDPPAASARARRQSRAVPAKGSQVASAPLPSCLQDSFRKVFHQGMENISCGTHSRPFPSQMFALPLAMVELLPGEKSISSAQLRA